MDWRRLTTWTFSLQPSGRGRVVVGALRCGRGGPGSNPGHGIDVKLLKQIQQIKWNKNEGEMLVLLSEICERDETKTDT